MKTCVITAVAAAALCAPALSQGATIVADPGSPYAEMLHSDKAATGKTVTLKSKPSGDYVDLTSLSPLDPAGNGDGFAQVDGPFAELTIDPQDPLFGFSKIGFTLNPIDTLGKGSDKLALFDYSFSIDLTFLGGGSQTLAVDAFPAFGKFDIWQSPADPGAISSVRIYNLGAWANEQVSNLVCTTKKGKETCKTEQSTVKVEKTGLTFEDIRHISYEGVYASVTAVPEPATWAMLIGGFFSVGAVLRRRRTAAAL